MKNESPYRDAVNNAPTPVAVDRATFEAKIITTPVTATVHGRS